jgi:hypothetical protein
MWRFSPCLKLAFCSFGQNTHSPLPSDYASNQKMAANNGYSGLQRPSRLQRIAYASPSDRFSIGAECALYMIARRVKCAANWELSPCFDWTLMVQKP